MSCSVCLQEEVGEDTVERRILKLALEVCLRVSQAGRAGHCVPGKEPQGQGTKEGKDIHATEVPDPRNL